MPVKHHHRRRGFFRRLADWFDREYLHFEHWEEEVVPAPVFMRRVRRSLIIAVAVYAFVQVVGLVGYINFAGLEPVRAFHAATMIITSQGPLPRGLHPKGLLFEALYAHLCYLVFIPLMHLTWVIAHRRAHIIVQRRRTAHPSNHISTSGGPPHVSS